MPFADIDSEGLIALGHGMSISGGVSANVPTLAEIEAVVGTDFLTDYYNYAAAQPDSTGRPSMSPMDLGALGRQAAGVTVDESDYVAWCMLLGRRAADKVNGTDANAVSVDLTTGDLTEDDSGYSLKGAGLEIMDRQRVFGGFEFTGATSHNGKTTLHHIPSWIEGFKWDARFPASPGMSNNHNADNFIVQNMRINGHAADLFVNSSMDYLWFAGSLDNKFTVDAGTDVFTTSEDHGLSENDAISVFAKTTDAVNGNGGLSPFDGTLPTYSGGSLAVQTVYYVRDVTANTFKLALTSGGAALDITSTGTGFQYWNNPGGYTLSHVSQNLRESPTGALWSMTNQNNRSIPRHITADNLWFHNSFGSNWVGASGTKNHATGRLVFGNSVQGRVCYNLVVPDTLGRLDLYGTTRSSHCRMQSPSIITTLRCSNAGPFGDGVSGSVWSNSPTDVGGSLNFINFQGRGSTRWRVGENPMRILDAEFDCRDDSGRSQPVPTAFTMESDLYLRGTVIGDGTGQSAFTVSDSTPQTILGSTNSLFKPYTVDIELTTIDCDGIDLAVGTETSGNRGLVDGRIVVTNTRKNGSEPDDGIDPADLDMTPDGTPPYANATEEYNALRVAGNGGVLIGVGKMKTAGGASRVPDTIKNKIYIERVPDWHANFLVHVNDLMTAQDVLRDIDDIVPTELTYRLPQTARTLLANLFPCQTSSTSNFVTLPGDILRHVPVHIVMEHPSSGPTWDIIPGGALVGNRSTMEIVSRIVTYRNYQADTPTYRRIFIVSNANKSEANTNVQNARHGANNFSLELTGSLWAACGVFDDTNMDEFMEAITTSQKSGTCTFDSASDTILSTGHSLNAGDKVCFRPNGGTLATGLIMPRVYYVINANANDFQVSLTSGGAAVTLTDDGDPWDYTSWYEVLLEEAIEVSATGPSAFRDALASNGYSLA